MCKSAVILAGGLGTRLRPFTQVIPKPLLPIGEKAILEIQIEKLKEHGFEQIFLATNYKSEYIESFFGDGSRYGVSLRLSKEDKPLGTAGPVRLLREQLQEPFLVMNGDILTLLDFSDFYRFAVAQDSLLTVGIKKIITPYAFGKISFEGDLLTDIEEKPSTETYAMAGIYVMKPDIMRYIPEDAYFGMDTLIRGMLQENAPVMKYEIDAYWLDIGRVDDYQQVQKEYFEQFANGDGEKK